MRGFFNRLRIRFTNPLSADTSWYQSHLLYREGDLVRLKTTSTIGYGNRIYEALVVGVSYFGLRNQIHYLCFRLDTRMLEHHYKWNLEHHFKRIRRKVQITDIMSLEEGLTHENEYIRSLACAC